MMQQKFAVILSLLASLLFGFASPAELANPNEPSIQSALTSAWKQVQAIKHPLLKNASGVKPSFVDAGHGLVSAEIDFAVNAEWNPKGPRSTSPDPVPLNPNRPYVFIQVTVYRPGPQSQPHFRSRGFRAGDIDYNVLITVASSDQELSNRVESILIHAFDPWHIFSPFSEAYRELTPLTEAWAKQIAIHECELYQKTEQNVATTVEAMPELPDYFRVHVIGKFNGNTITSSVLVHRFNPFKGSRIEATTADLEFVPNSVDNSVDLRPVTAIADDLRKVLQPSWNLTCSNHVIRIKSKQTVWLLGPSLPGKDSGESEEHYARKNGYKTKYEVALTFVPRLHLDQLEYIRKVRDPWERAFAKGVGSKAKASEFANALAQHPLPMFYTDDGYSVFVEWPYGSEGVYPPDAAAQVEQLVATLRKSFHEYNYPPPELVAAALTDLKQSEVIGRLGKPFGEREVIVGVFGGNIMLPNPLAISEVNGAALKPVTLEIRGGVKIEKGVTYRLEGYESGEFSGPPDWVDSGAQSPFQFRNFFNVTKIIEAKARATPRHGPIVTNDFAFTDLKPSEVIGRLGKPLGEREVIVGSFVEPLMLVNPLAISEVNGATLKPVTLEILGDVKIEKGVRYRLEGYESGAFSGSPSWTGPGVQQPFVFHNFFQVTKIIEAKVQSSRENR